MKRVCLVLLAMVMLLSFSSCLIQIDPNNQVAKYETFGRNLGSYFKYKYPEFVVKAKPYIKGVLTLSDAELFNEDVLQLAYTYALDKYPKDRELILLVKSGIDLYGIKLDMSEILPDDRPEYVKSVRALLKGFYKTAETEL